MTDSMNANVAAHRSISDRSNNQSSSNAVQNGAQQQFQPSQKISSDKISLNKSQPNGTQMQPSLITLVGAGQENQTNTATKSMNNSNVPPKPMMVYQKKPSNGSSTGRSKSKQKVNDENLSIWQRIKNRATRRSNTINSNGDQTPNNGKPQEQTLRNVVVAPLNLPTRPHENAAFVTNKITTTKYTIWSFLPKSIIVQFMRMSNVYFLATAVMTTIPGFSPISPASTFVPLCFVIFMSILREAYEDFKRRLNDKLTNNQKCRILRDVKSFENCCGSPDLETTNQLSSNHGSRWDPSRCRNKEETTKLRNHFKECLWEEVKCGDLLFLEEGDHLPADVVFLLSSAENGECFVQTATLDGERALKHKQCLVPVKTAIENHGLNNFEAMFFCEAPSKNLYEFSGYIQSEHFPEKGTVLLKNETKKRTITMDNKQMGLRGSNLANTAWAIGVAVYTGKDSKLMMNYGLSRFKQSRIEKVINKICFYLIIAQAVLCIIMSVYSGYYVSDYAEPTADGLRRKAEYIFYTELSSFGRSENGTATDSQNIVYSPTKEGITTYGMYFVLLNTLIPLSLVVSIEFIKMTQTAFIGHDVEMYDEVQMKQCQPISMTLHEEMASIKYIFADKTGTLTANIMQFKACTVGSVCYDDEYRDEDYEYEQGAENDSVTPGATPRNDNQIIEEEIKITVHDEDDHKMDAEQFEQYKLERKQTFNEPGKESKTLRRQNSITKIVWNFKEAAQIIHNLLEKNRYFNNEETNLGQSRRNGPQLILQKQNEYLHQFWLCVALCHDVITTLDQQTGQRHYQGTSPDEITLLDAGKEVGYIFLDRTSETMKIEVFGRQKTYRLLQKFEFTSDRKKMSVVVQDEQTGMIILYSKGADLAIFDRLSTQLDQHFLEATKEDLIKFSTKGFRTLCFAIRVLDEDYFKEWQGNYEAAKLELIKHGVGKVVQASSFRGALNDPEANLNALQNELESNLFLLGATALEDKLQDGVPEVIEDFRNAGIKVWMLTGDKLETAENIGFSSKMFNEKMFIFKLQTADKITTRSRLQQIEQKIFDIEKQHATPVIGTQFILNPNAATDYEAKNIIRALEEFKHESRASEYTLNSSWARKPILRRKVRKRLEEIVPDKNAIAERLIREHQVFFNKASEAQLQYIPQSFDMNANQYIIRRTNIFRSTASQKIKEASRGLNLGGINLTIAPQGGTDNIIDNEDKFGILVEGSTLQFIQDSKSMKSKFLKILGKCEAVIVCRASPSQKGQMVEMIKENEPEAVTLAIGDGANDVNMIQKAHVGVGIFGKEGYQAAGNSDYAIGQFRFLKRLLFTHGRWSGIRLTIFMLIFFNKNIVFTLPEFLFGWNNGFSGQAYYDEVYMSAFNLFATNLAVCLMAVWEIDVIQDVKDKSYGLISIFSPQMYRYSQDNELFSIKKFIAWSCVSILQSLFIYGIPQLSYQDWIFNDGRKQDFWAQGMCSYFAVVIAHYATVCFFSQHWTLWTFFWYSISIFLFAPFQICVYDSMIETGYPMAGRLAEIAFSNHQFWLTVAVSVAICLVPVAFYFNANSLLFPSLKDLINQEILNQKQVLDEADPKRAKEALDLFKQQQLHAQQMWDANYNTFSHPTNKEQTSHPAAKEREMTPNKGLMQLATPARKGQAAQNTLTIDKVEGVDNAIGEENNQLGQQQKETNQKLTKGGALLHDGLSPLRLSNSRKGLSFFKQQGAEGSHVTVPGKISNIGNQQFQPKQLTVSPEEEEPLRLSKSAASKSNASPDFKQETTQQNRPVIDEEVKQRERIQQSNYEKDSPDREDEEDMINQSIESIGGGHLQNKMLHMRTSFEEVSQIFKKSFAQKPESSRIKTPSKKE